MSAPELYDLCLVQPENKEQVWTVDETFFQVEKRMFFADVGVFAYEGETSLDEGGNDHVCGWTRSKEHALAFAQQLVNDRRRRIAHLKSVIAKK